MLPVSTKVKKVIYYNIIILALTTAGVSAASSILFRGENIYPSISIGEIDVGRLAKEEASSSIHDYLANQSDKPLVTLIAEGTEWPIYANDIHASYDVSQSVEKAFSVAREGDVLYRIRERYTVMQQGKKIPLQMTYDEQELNRFVALVAKSVNRPAQNASITFSNGSLVKTVHQIGQQLPEDEAVKMIKEAITSGWGKRLNLTPTQIEPRISSDDIHMISQEWISFATEFDPTDGNRTENIVLAAKAIHGTILKPGEAFSFNTVVGPRIREKGYKDAPVFIQGKLVLDAGGGVCQVTSTLYNAVLLANLDIIERSSHFRPPGYVPIGLDATVADHVLDFRFRNTSPSSLYITCEIIGNRVEIRLFGSDIKRPDVRIDAVDKQVFDAKTIIKQDPTLAIGQQVVEQEEQKGYRVTTERVLLENGKEIKREILSHDDFTPVEKIIRVGTKSVDKGTKK